MPAEHFVQLFDTIEARAESLSAFVNQGIAVDEDVVVFATADHWKAVDERLHSTGQRIGSAIADGRLSVVNARETLDDIMRRGRPDPVQFSACVARAVPENHVSQTRGVRVYGELVDLLAEEGNFTAAIALERLWNDLLNSRPFTLMCGYCSAHFANPRAGSALRDVCGCHSRIQSADDHSLGSYLIAESERRRMAVRVLLSSGQHRIVETADAARLNGHFFEVTQKYREGLTHTVLTLRASDVIGADIVKDAKVVDYVVGGARPPGEGTA